MKYTNARYPEKINDLIDNDGKLSEEGQAVIGNPVIANNGVLNIDKIEMPVGPVPVAEFDGVKYYHKHEFDLLALMEKPSGCFNLLTGEEVNEQFPWNISIARIGRYSSGPGIQAVGIGYKNGSSISIYLAPNPYGIEVDYTSHSWVIKETSKEVSGATEIWLPGYTAYYGFLSADGNTFISYWNEGESEPTEITEVTDGKTTLPIHDGRVESLQQEMAEKQDKIEVTVGDVGKIVGVNNNGELALIPAPSSGTKLYKHEIIFNPDTYRFILISTDSDNYKNHTSTNILAIQGVAHNQYMAQQGISASISDYGIIIASVYYITHDGEDFSVHIIEGNVVSDTVTEL